MGARRQIVAVGLSAIVSLALAAAVILVPLTHVEHTIGTSQRAHIELQKEVAQLRTTLVQFQEFAEVEYDLVSGTDAKIDSQALADGVQLGQSQATEWKALVSNLRRNQLDSSARELEAATAKYNTALNTFLPVVTGTKYPALVLAAAISAERVVFADVWNVTTTLSKRMRALVAADADAVDARVRTTRLIFEVLLVLAAALVTMTVIVVGRRARRREIASGRAKRRSDFEADLQQALEMSKTELGVFNVVGEALGDAVGDLHTEMLIADSSRAHFHRAVSTAEADDEPGGCGVVSPLDCPAASRGQTLTFPTSRALGACPQLKGRPGGACSAVCIPLAIGAKTVAVVHATGADGEPPDPTDVGYLQITARRVSDRIAMLRAFERSEIQAKTDPLTGLMNRRSFENRVRELQTDGVPYALAYGDLDHFKDLNDVHGHEAGDHALRLFSRVVRDAVRPSDLPARYGGEEFVILLPECEPDEAITVLERVRERLALALTSGRVVPFTVSFGLASSEDGPTFDAVLSVADRALLQAKAAGRNRVVRAQPSVDVAGRLEVPAEIRPRVGS